MSGYLADRGDGLALDGFGHIVQGFRLLFVGDPSPVPALLHFKPELGLHRLDIAQRDAGFVVAFDDNATVQPSLRDLVHRCIEPPQRPGDRAYSLQAHDAPEQQARAQEAQHKADDNRIFMLRGVVFELRFLDLDCDELVQVGLRRAEQFLGFSGMEGSQFIEFAGGKQWQPGIDSLLAIVLSRLYIRVRDALLFRGEIGRHVLRPDLADHLGILQDLFGHTFD